MPLQPVFCIENAVLDLLFKLSEVRSILMQESRLSLSLHRLYLGCAALMLALATGDHPAMAQVAPASSHPNRDGAFPSPNASEAAGLQAHPLPQPQFPGKRSLWFGFDRFDFEADGKPVLVVAPKVEAPGRPWAWHGEFFGHKPDPDIALLGRGFHIVYMTVPDMLGCPEAVAHWNVLYRALTENYGFAKKAALVGLSRGGLYVYNWAEANPDKVACIYGDAPVCDLKSWPGGKGKGPGSPHDWQLAMQLYGFKSEAEAIAYRGNPVDNLAPLAAAKIPLLHVYGDADEVVPWDENTGLVAERYKQLGGKITLISKPGGKHHPHSLGDPTPIASFLWENTANAEAKAWLAARGIGSLNTESITLFVSPQGDDANPGSILKPVATLSRAQMLARQIKKGGAATIFLRGGTYYLPQTLVFTPEDSGTASAPITFRAWKGETPVVSGGIRLELSWEPWRNGIMKAKVPADLVSDQLFVNGDRQPMARYPNFDPNAAYFNGFAADAISLERATRWANPAGGYLHAMHKEMWGDFHYLITGKDSGGAITYIGGWQNNRKMGMHPRFRFVENIFEELDAPGEWFLDQASHTLYFYPPKGLDLTHATIESARLRHLIEFRGTADKPVQFVRFEGITFRHAARTFMDNREPLLRSDWTIYRGGSVFYAGTEDCSLEGCFLDQLGGNAVFVSGYNRRLAIRRCHIAGAGANGVSFVGDPLAVRSPLFEYKERQRLDQIDRNPGPKTPDYPADCLVEDCLIHATGRVEKQTAPVEIAMSRNITIRHCSIYDVPRAGINIGDGCWGGDIIEDCDIFDTVKETGDHGSFNSWGRDRYWGLQGADLNTVTLGENRDLPRLDTVAPNILRHNRWRCDHGWDIDLDDGSSNYEIRDNLCLNGGIKLREGFYRVVENNIMVNNSFHPHVWYVDSQDVFAKNIVFTKYRPIGVKPPWGRECDANLLHHPGQTEPAPALELQKQSGRDGHSIEADALFVAPERGDYQVKNESPAIGLGFVNFAMDDFGVRDPSLRALARAPVAKPQIYEK